jgi:hypothetical protein
MGTDGLSISDAMSIARDNDGTFGGNGAWVFFLFFLLAWGGNGIWGNNGSRQAATTDDIQNQFNFAALERQNNEIAAAVKDAAYNVNSETKDNFFNLGQTVRDVKDVVQANNYEINSASCAVNRNIDSIRYDAAMNTKELLASNCAQTQKILDVLTGNRMADMQNQINSLQLQAALSGVVRYPQAYTYNAGPGPLPFYGGMSYYAN